MGKPRKCIYTNNEANTRDLVVPNILHNWDNRAPASADYLNTKHHRLPSELEMEANRIFHLLELARLDVIYFEKKLSAVQEALKDNRDEEIEKAHHMRGLDESLEVEAKNIVTKTINKKVWD